MALINLGNVVGLLVSDTAPDDKTYLLWARPIGTDPETYDLFYFRNGSWGKFVDDFGQAPLAISNATYQAGNLVPNKLYYIDNGAVFVRPVAANPYYPGVSGVFGVTVNNKPCLWDSETNTYVEIQPPSVTPVTYDDWTSGTVYTVDTPGGRVTRITKLFKYINVTPSSNHDPLLEDPEAPVYWREISPAPREFGYSYDDYLANNGGFEVVGKKKDVVRKLVDIGGGEFALRLYEAIFTGQAGENYVSTDFDTELTNGDWKIVGGAGEGITPEVPSLSEVLLAGNVADKDVTLLNGIVVEWTTEDLSESASLGFSGDDLGIAPTLELRHLDEFVVLGPEEQLVASFNRLGAELRGLNVDDEATFSRVGAKYDEGLSKGIVYLYAEDEIESTDVQVRPDGMYINGVLFAGATTPNLAEILLEGADSGGTDAIFSAESKLTFANSNFITQEAFIQMISGFLVIDNDTTTVIMQNGEGFAYFDSSGASLIGKDLDGDVDAIAQLNVWGVGGAYISMSVVNSTTPEKNIKLRPEYLEIDNAGEPTVGWPLGHTVSGLGYMDPEAIGMLPASIAGETFQNQGGTVVPTSILVDSESLNRYDIEDNLLYDSDPTDPKVSIDPAYRLLKRFDGSTSVDWENETILKGEGYNYVICQSVNTGVPATDVQTNWTILLNAQIAAVALATAITATATNRVKVIIMPGVYDQQALGALPIVDFIDFVGLDGCRESTILNSPSATIDIPSDINVRLQNLTINADDSLSINHTDDGLTNFIGTDLIIKDTTGAENENGAWENVIAETAFAPKAISSGSYKNVTVSGITSFGNDSSGSMAGTYDNIIVPDEFQMLAVTGSAIIKNSYFFITNGPNILDIADGAAIENCTMVTSIGDSMTCSAPVSIFCRFSTFRNAWGADITNQYSDDAVNDPMGIVGGQNIYISGDGIAMFTLGSTTFAAVFATVTYTVTHGLVFRPTMVAIQAQNEDAASALSYVDNITSTTFDITFIAVPTGNPLFGWVAYR